MQLLNFEELFIELSALQLTVIKPKPKLLQGPIGGQENTLKSQSELKVKTSKSPKAQENAGDQVVIDFSFSYQWSGEWCEFPDQTHRAR